MIKNIVQAIFMMCIGYAGIFLLELYGVGFSGVAFTPIGFIVMFNLALMYTFYFKL